MPTRPATLKGRQRSAPNCYKPKRTERQFATNDRRWRLIRAAQLAEQPCCRHCWEDNGIIHPANEVDHIDGDPMNNDPDNLQSLCKRHHSAKTAREKLGRQERA